jgi:predicted membrane protein (TIGR00267 family)
MDILEYFQRHIRRFKTYVRISRAHQIARRLFVMNAFDGVLTIMGVVIGTYLSGVTDPRVVITAGVGGSIAMGISGMSGAYMAERAERKRDLIKLEESMLTSLEDTQFAKASEFAPYIVALVDGISPSASAIILILPYLFVPYIEFATAFYVSLMLGLFILFMLGIYLARISEERQFFSGLRMIIVGLITIFVVSLAVSHGNI